MNLAMGPFSCVITSWFVLYAALGPITTTAPAMLHTPSLLQTRRGMNKPRGIGRASMLATDTTQRQQLVGWAAHADERLAFIYHFLYRTGISPWFRACAVQYL